MSDPQPRSSALRDTDGFAILVILKPIFFLSHSYNSDECLHLCNHVFFTVHALPGLQGIRVSNVPAFQIPFPWHFSSLCVTRDTGTLAPHQHPSTCTNRINRARSSSAILGQKPRPRRLGVPCPTTV